MIHREDGAGLAVDVVSGIHLTSGGEKGLHEVT